MSTLGWFVTLALAIEACAVYLWAHRAVPRRFLRWGRDDPVRTGFLVLLFHLSWVALAVLVAGWHRPLSLTGGAGEIGLGLVLMLLLAILGPASILWFPRLYLSAPFEREREAFEANGASPSTAAAFYWTGAPFGIVGVPVWVLTLVVWFPAS